jgi:hypothetical protein
MICSKCGNEYGLPDRPMPHDPVECERLLGLPEKYILPPELLFEVAAHYGKGPHRGVEWAMDVAARWMRQAIIDEIRIECTAGAVNATVCVNACHDRMVELARKVGT